MDAASDGVPAPPPGAGPGDPAPHAAASSRSAGPADVAAAAVVAAAAAENERPRPAGERRPRRLAGFPRCAQRPADAAPTRPAAPACAGSSWGTRWWVDAWTGVTWACVGLVGAVAAPAAPSAGSPGSTVWAAGCPRRAGVPAAASGDSGAAGGCVGERGWARGGCLIACSCD